MVMVKIFIVFISCANKPYPATDKNDLVSGLSLLCCKLGSVYNMWNAAFWEAKTLNGR